MQGGSGKRWGAGVRRSLSHSGQLLKSELMHEIDGDEVDGEEIQSDIKPEQERSHE